MWSRKDMVEEGVWSRKDMVEEGVWSRKDMVEEGVWSRKELVSRCQTPHENIRRGSLGTLAYQISSSGMLVGAVT